MLNGQTQKKTRTLPSPDCCSPRSSYFAEFSLLPLFLQSSGCLGFVSSVAGRCGCKSCCNDGMRSCRLSRDKVHLNTSEKTVVSPFREKRGHIQAVLPLSQTDWPKGSQIRSGFRKRGLANGVSPFFLKMKRKKGKKTKKKEENGKEGRKRKENKEKTEKNGKYRKRHRSGDPFCETPI